MKSLHDLYDEANRLGEILDLSFWIERPGYGPQNRVCGEVLIWDDREDATVCDLPYGVEHEHQPCAYCQRVFTYVGESEVVCEDHIRPEARGEYQSVLAESDDRFSVGDRFVAYEKVWEITDVFPDGYRVSEVE